ncbi:hypothetical protein [Alistipes finegoldii]|uniref:hypothetical protein n=1 Tax=Alistipes finegoldii TaxID=214856 RepID=UPI0026665DFB|nr:hypothetical protein [Alistipes finegoldii]
MEERVTGRRQQNEEPNKRRTETGREKSGKPTAAGKAGNRRGTEKRKEPDTNGRTGNRAQAAERRTE